MPSTRNLNKYFDVYIHTLTAKINGICVDAFRIATPNG